MIRHIVMWTFRKGEEEKAEEFLAGLQSLDGVIPQIRRMELRRAEGGDSSACLIADFDSFEDLAVYKEDPRHKAVSALCKSIRESRKSIDFTI